LDLRQGEGTCKLLTIKQVAQAAGFYDDDVEKSLNEDVEKPGNDVIDSLRMATPMWIRKMLELRGIPFEELHHPEV
ncbi:MAG TPA: hypothetical protein VEM32_02570, partial [Geobacteraceae bacterium]|nr:hypothetical protein [Geobacteraceae bacterium]